MSSDLPNYEQAASIVAEHARAILEKRVGQVEMVELTSASGHILASPLRADDDQPPFPRSTRDGYACRAAEASAHIQLPIAGSTHAGQPPAGPLPPTSAWEIMTGAPVPAGADCVVMLEHVERSDNTIQLAPSRTIALGDNIVAQGAQSRRKCNPASHGPSFRSLSLLVNWRPRYEPRSHRIRHLCQKALSRSDGNRSGRSFEHLCSVFGTVRERLKWIDTPRSSKQ